MNLYALDTAVTMDEVADLKNACERPGEEIEQIERCDRSEIFEDGIDPENAEDAGARDDEDHREQTFTEPA